MPERGSESLLGKGSAKVDELASLTGQQQACQTRVEAEDAYGMVILVNQNPGLIPFRVLY
ncbi:hypothetical protein COLO4_20941 [Corchorus olitorius]|uniref:Uncharacterized protein n=1 Tax=Corchorus olitorius TaxID=93759 RepID=A0A1R3IW00_9ROSI|nr:hypothetical protein COLO4_20941 [Corchorus olitorius]